MKNIKFVNVNISSTKSARAGLIAGEFTNNPVTLTNISIDGLQVSGNNTNGVGGLGGYLNQSLTASQIAIVNANISNVHNGAGGLFGRIGDSGATWDVSVTDVYMNNVTLLAKERVGGLFGELNGGADSELVNHVNATINNVVLIGMDLSTTADIGYGGGISGKHNPKGGLLGTVNNTFFEGVITTSKVGHVAADKKFETVTNYWFKGTDVLGSEQNTENLLAVDSTQDQAWWDTNLVVFSTNDAWVYDETLNLYKLKSAGEPILEPETYTVTLTGEGLSSTPEVLTNLAEGTKVTIQVTVPAHKTIATFKVDNVDAVLNEDNTYLLTVSGNHVVTVTYNDILYKVTLSGEGLSSENTLVDLLVGTKVTIQVTVPAHKTIATFKVDNVDAVLNEDNTYLLTVSGNHVVTVTYNDILYKVTLSGEGLSSENTLVDLLVGTKVTIQVTVPAHKTIATFKVDNVDAVLNEDNTYLLTVSGNHVVTVTYNDVLYDVTLMNTELSSENTLTDLLAGTKVTIKVTIPEGKEVDKFYVGTVETVLDTETTYELTVSGNHNVSVSFKVKQYSVVFKVGESTYHTATVNHGEKVAQPANPEAPENHKFLGWFKDGVLYGFDENVTSGFTLMAEFKNLVATVGTKEDLNNALADNDIIKIVIADNIEVTDQILINRALILQGTEGKALTFTGANIEVNTDKDLTITGLTILDSDLGAYKAAINTQQVGKLSLDGVTIKNITNDNQAGVGVRVLSGREVVILNSHIEGTEHNNLNIYNAQNLTKIQVNNTTFKHWDSNQDPAKPLDGWLDDKYAGGRAIRIELDGVTTPIPFDLSGNTFIQAGYENPPIDAQWIKITLIPEDQTIDLSNTTFAGVEVLEDKVQLLPNIENLAWYVGDNEIDLTNGLVSSLGLLERKPVIANATTSEELVAAFAVPTVKTINLAAGTYAVSEQLLVNRGLVIQGVEGTIVTFNGGNFEVNTDKDLTITGLTILDSDLGAYKAAINTQQVGKLSLDGVTIKNITNDNQAGVGVRVLSGKEVVILNSHIEGTEHNNLNIYNAQNLTKIQVNNTTFKHWDSNQDPAKPLDGWLDDKYAGGRAIRIELDGVTTPIPFDLSGNTFIQAGYENPPIDAQWIKITLIPEDQTIDLSNTTFAGVEVLEDKVQLLPNIENLAWYVGDNEIDLTNGLVSSLGLLERKPVIANATTSEELVAAFAVPTVKTINLAAGTYAVSEQLLVNRGLVIQGVEGTIVTFNGGNFEVNTDKDLTITGLTILDSDLGAYKAAINTQQVGKLSLDGVTIKNITNDNQAGVGVRVLSGKEVVILNSHIEGTEHNNLNIYNAQNLTKIQVNNTTFKHWDSNQDPAKPLDGWLDDKYAGGRAIRIELDGVTIPITFDLSGNTFIQAGYENPPIDAQWIKITLIPEDQTIDLSNTTFAGVEVLDSKLQLLASSPDIEWYVEGVKVDFINGLVSDLGLLEQAATYAYVENVSELEAALVDPAIRYIEMAAGTYNVSNQIEVDRELTIVGVPGVEGTVVTFNGGNFEVNTDKDLTITGLTILDSDLGAYKAAINTQQVGKLSLDGVTIKNITNDNQAGVGVRVLSGREVVILNSHIEGTEHNNLNIYNAQNLTKIQVNNTTFKHWDSNQDPAKPLDGWLDDKYAGGRAIRIELDGVTTPIPFDLSGNTFIQAGYENPPIDAQWIKITLIPEDQTIDLSNTTFAGVEVLEDKVQLLPNIENLAWYVGDNEIDLTNGLVSSLGLLERKPVIANATTSEELVAAFAVPTVKTINLAAGTYAVSEQLLVNRGLVIQGVEGTVVTFNGGNFEVNTDKDLTITGLTILDSDLGAYKAAINTQQVGKLSLDGVTIKNITNDNQAGVGVRVLSGKEVVILNSHIEGTEHNNLNIYNAQNLTKIQVNNTTFKHWDSNQDPAKPLDGWLDDKYAGGRAIRIELDGVTIPITFDLSGNTFIQAGYENPPIDAQWIKITLIPEDQTIDLSNTTFAGVEVLEDKVQLLPNIENLAWYVGDNEIDLTNGLVSSLGLLERKRVIANVSTLSELRNALSSEISPYVHTINLTENIVVDDVTKENADTKLLVLGRDNVTINGNNHSISGDDPAGWAFGPGTRAFYVLQVYKATGITINNLTLDGGDAGLCVNGSQVTINNVTLTDSEAGGIEVSKGDGVTTDPKLTVTGTFNYMTLTVPPIWIDGKTTNDGWVVHTEDFVEATYVVDGKNQLMFIPEIAQATYVRTVTFDYAGYSPVKVICNSRVLKPAVDPTAFEYKFVEWQLNGETYNFNSLVIENITLTAKMKHLVATVTNETELTDALDDVEIIRIEFGDNITIVEDRLPLRSNLVIDGKNYKIIQTHVAGWDSDYAFQAYKKTGVVIKNLTFDGGDAALLVNGSEVTVENIKIMNMEYGGIEVSQGGGVTTAPKLTVSDAIDYTSDKLPTIWLDKKQVNDGWVVQTGLTEIVYEFKNQLWFVGAAFTGAEVAVKNETNLTAALGHKNVKVIHLANDINLVNQALIGRNNVTLNGHGFTLTLPNVEKWNGEYVLQVYKATGVVLEDLQLSGGDAGLLVNGSVVTANNLTVKNHEYGGVEVSKGDGVATDPKLTVTGTFNYMTLTVPPIWIDGKTTNDGWVVHTEDFVEATYVVDGKNQLMFIPEIAQATYVRTVTFDYAGYSPVKVIYNSRVLKPEVDPYKEGHTFVEWQLNSETYNFNSLVTDNITLVAYFTENDPAIQYVLTYDKTGLSGTNYEEFTAAEECGTWSGRANIQNDTQIGTNATYNVTFTANDGYYIEGVRIVVNSGSDNARKVSVGDEVIASGIVKNNSPVDSGKVDLIGELTTITLVPNGPLQYDSITVYVKQLPPNPARDDINEITFAQTTYNTAGSGVITLPSTGSNSSQISWDTTDNQVINLDGDVALPENTKQVTLTATATKGDYTYSKEFVFTVVGIRTRVNEQLLLLVPSIPSNTTENFNLPKKTNDDRSTITWSSQHSGIVIQVGETITAEVMQSTSDVTDTITATVVEGGYTMTKTYTITVPKEGGATIHNATLSGAAMSESLGTTSNTSLNDGTSYTGEPNFDYATGLGLDTTIFDVTFAKNEANLWAANGGVLRGYYNAAGGGSITIDIDNSYVISEIRINLKGADKAGANTLSVNNVTYNFNISPKATGTDTVTATSLNTTSVTIQCTHTNRMYIESIEIDYTTP
ncbi:MAG: immunoglobulin-like domain-containing protein [Acholeplasmataceae bacterium]